MKVAFIHLSDLHYRKNWEEQCGVVLEGLFSDLKKQIMQLGATVPYLVFSGDFVLGGEHTDQYSELSELLDKKLNDINVPRERRICVPGNHDASQVTIRNAHAQHEGIIALGLRESEFNDYILQTPNLLTDKFSNYDLFENKMAACGAKGDSHGGAGWLLNHDIGVYCLNTALCTGGGLKPFNEDKSNDKKRLAIETRTLQKWLLSCPARQKILVMHHPVEYLTEWAQIELNAILRKHFALCLCGHAHVQSSHHKINNGTPLVECIAPPLFTNKRDGLGYAIISVAPDKGVLDISYRQWTTQYSFVSGVNFSNTDDGKIHIVPVESTSQAPVSNTSHFDHVNHILGSRLDEALRSYQSQPRVWVEPTLSKSAEIEENADSAPKVEVSSLIASPQSTIIHAPPQFGLTCLALYMARQAWLAETKQLWLYLDARLISSHTGSIDKAIDKELRELKSDRCSIKCILLDSWLGLEKDSVKLVKALCETFVDVPIIVFHTFDSKNFLSPTEEDDPNRLFDKLFLWSLPRNCIRQVVAGYNEVSVVGEEDAVTNRIVKDLEVLNLHRTPLNCLTLLKVYEVDFDESPVNRTEMIRRVLFLLFCVDDMPTYKTRPDLKDCEYVLGYFCETVLRTCRYSFTKQEFISTTGRLCSERFIDLDVAVVFDVLLINHILVKRDDMFFFRFTYWVFYFGAQRMHHDDAFAQYIFKDMAYIHFPEIIEFYTGIDRRREDALKVLIKDIDASYDKVKDKCGFPENLNPFRFAHWNPSEKTLAIMQNEIRDGIQGSNLPAVVKDGYADLQYDRQRPYSQEIKTIMHEFSLSVMMQVMTAAARALRNSDYVDPVIKKKLLTSITLCWEQLSKVLLVLMPLLAERGNASFEGAGFFLCSDFGDTPAKRLLNLLMEIPANIISWNEDDLFSQKMGPLLLNQFSTEKNEIRRHLLVLLAIRQRPRGWKMKVQSYIAECSKNSFYLFDVYRALRRQHRYGFASPKSLTDIAALIKMTSEKHARKNVAKHT